MTLIALALLAAPATHADGGSGLRPGMTVASAVTPATGVAHAGVGYRAGELDEAFTSAAAEFGVPRPILMAIGYEATHWQPVATTPWGGWGMYDLREGDEDPSLEHAAALLTTNPNEVALDWRLNVRGAAAILADQARLSHGGALPSATDYAAWWDAVRAFSGRQEPNLQDTYARWVFRTIETGLEADTLWGRVRIEPTWVGFDYGTDAAPPPAGDSSVAAQLVSAASCNYSDYSRGASDIDMIVIHTVQGSYSGCYSWFQNCDASASAHYVVRSSDGQVTQMVREADVAWHAGNWDVNLESVGIEHEGYVDDCSYYTSALYAGSAALSADIASRQGVPLDRSHIIGHNEVPDPYNPGEYGGSGHHTDPGSCWDWDYYMGLLTGSASSSGGEILGVVADSDIYNGTRLVGATVWIAETGESGTTDSSGTYRFEDVPFGSYTIHASYPGYAEGTCSKSTSGTQEWCSIALYPDSGGGNGGGDTGGDNGTTDSGGGTGGEDSGSVDTDTGIETPGGDAGPLQLPGAPVYEDAVGGCSTAPGAGLGWLAVGVAGLLVQRRRIAGS